MQERGNEPVVKFEVNRDQLPPRPRAIIAQGMGKFALDWRKRDLPLAVLVPVIDGSVSVDCVAVLDITLQLGLAKPPRRNNFPMQCQSLEKAAYMASSTNAGGAADGAAGGSDGGAAAGSAGGYDGGAALSSSSLEFPDCTSRKRVLSAM